MSTVNPTSVAPAAQATPQSSALNPSNTTQNPFGKDAFMKLLVEQLRNQSPDSSQDPDKFMDQMTQFSILEQLQNQSTSQQRTDAAAYLGKTVSWASADGKSGSGLVEKVDFGGKNGPVLTVNGQSGVLPADVVQVQ
ncbi:MAG TPA: flagellar hook capping FlgD N-terminal domain-containing protein [Solirubrobacteraceae bacterium]